MVELLLNIFVSGWALFRNPWSVVDSCIIFSGMLEVILTAGGISAKEFALLRLFRLLRILRLMKLCRHHRWLTELKTLVMMMASCVRTLFWSFLFCFIVMSAWSMAAVELINPVVQQMAADGAFGDCRTCRSALTSVMRANLTMFQTIIAGDSWGDLAVPVIEAHPWTAIIFIGSLLTLVFGVLNLIVAVVIDTYAERRQKDVINLAQELDAEAADDRRFLHRIFDQIDEDGSGRLRVMDIDEQDLLQMFEMIDGDGSGSVDPEEFITALNRWAKHSKTAARFAKHQLMRSIVQHAELHQQVMSKLDSLEKRLNTEALDVLVTVDGDETTDTFNNREEKLITVVADESPLAEEFQVRGSGELAEGQEVEGSESEEPATPGGIGRSRSFKKAAELTLKKTMPKSLGSSGSFEKMSLRQSVADLAIGCQAVGAAPLNRAVPPLLGSRSRQSTSAVCVNSESSTNSSSNNDNNNDDNNINIKEKQLCVQEDSSLDGPEQPHIALRYIPFTWLTVVAENNELTSVKQQQKQHKEPSDNQRSAAKSEF
ncbi:unnamed protein product [Polarella glacialis]|nr:unnamed protein product [Polarella glacialis]